MTSMEKVSTDEVISKAFLNLLLKFVQLHTCLVKFSSLTQGLLEEGRGDGGSPRPKRSLSEEGGEGDGFCSG